MPVLVDVATLRAQLRLAPEGDGEDVLLQRKINAATASCALELDRDLDELTEAERSVVTEAILVWATVLYEDRGGSDGTPPAVRALLRPIRSLAR